jgi:hypothetical protein
MREPDLVKAERKSRRAFNKSGPAWWYVGRHACYFHREGGWIHVRTAAIRRALAVMDRQLVAAQRRGRP